MLLRPHAPRVFAVAAALLVGPGIPASHALEPLLEGSGYRHDVWRKRDGLPSDGVGAIFQSADGYVWVATQEGVVRFDGARFQALNARGADELVSRDVVDLFEDARGALWFATQGQGAFRLADGQLRRVDGLAHEFVRGFAPASDGAVWVGTSRGVSVVRGAKVRTSKPAPALDASVRALATDRDGTLWIGTASGLAHIKDDVWSRAQTGSPADGEEVRSLLADRDDTLWVGLRSGKLVHLRRGQARVYGREHGLADDPVALLRDRGGRLWVAAAKQLQWMEGERFVSAEIQPLCERRLVGLAEDREGGLWVATNGCGVHRFSDRPELRLISFEGQPSAVHGALDGTVAVGLWDGSVDRVKPQAAPWPATSLGRLPQIFVESAERAWFVGDERLFRAEDGRVERVEGEGAVETVHVDRQGRQWIGRGNAAEVVRIDPDGRRHVFIEKDGVRLPRQFYEADDGTVWLITDKGVARFDGQTFRRYDADLPSKPYLSSAWQDPQGRLWVTSSLHGLATLEGARLRFFSTSEGLPSRRLFFMTADRHGRVWLSGSQGLFHLELTTLQELAAGQRKQVSPVLFGAAERVQMPSHQAGSQSGWKAPDGTIYVLGQRSVIHVDPGKRRPPPGSPAAVVETLTIDETRPPLQKTVVAGPTRGDLRVEFTALTFEAPEQVQFQYLLEGFDARWVDAGPLRVARYTKVPPGSFRFRVRAWRAGQPSPGAEATFALTLRPAFHQTGWFYGLLGLAAASVAFAAHRLRLAAARGRYEAILAERTRMSREIHDTLAQGFAAISAQIECARDALVHAPQLAQQDLERARELCRASLQEARRTVWGLRPDVVEQRGLAGALEQVAAQLQGHPPVQVAIDGAPRRLPSPVEDNLLRIAQEALANAVHHAQARAVTVRLRYGAANVRLAIEDDGQGLGAEAPIDGRPRLGIVGMRERASAIGASFEIESAPGGTRIIVEVNA